MNGSHRISTLGSLAAAAALAVVTAARPAHAQEPGRVIDDSQRLRPGQIAERVVSPTDSTQTHAIFIPSTYTTERDWPIVFLMDPRGRALIPLRRMAPAAERHGYILMSSYNTLSDGPAEPNVRAINAMLADAEATFSLDPHRYYLAGFSGTARITWDFADQLGGEVAGIFGASGGPAQLMRWKLPGSKPPHVAFFGTAGTGDFNYQEMVNLDTTLVAWELPHSLRWFDGPHAWPPGTLFAEALDWFQLQAMRDGKVERDAAFLDSLFTADTTAAHALETSGASLAALDRYRQIAIDFDGICDVAAVRAAADRLAGDETVREQLDRRADIAQEWADYSRTVALFARAAGGTRPVNVGWSLQDLRIEPLRKRAANTTDPMDAQAAARMLEQTFVSASFYVPRSLLAKHEPDRALAVLRVADGIHADRPQVLLNMARAYAELKDADQAFTALERAVDKGASVDVLRSDSTLLNLREDPRFAALLARSR